MKFNEKELEYLKYGIIHELETKRNMRNMFAGNKTDNQSSAYEYFHKETVFLENLLAKLEKEGR